MKHSTTDKKQLEDQIAMATDLLNWWTKENRSESNWPLPLTYTIIRGDLMTGVFRLSIKDLHKSNLPQKMLEELSQAVRQ